MRHSTRQHKCNRDNTSITRVQHEAARLQNNLKFILIYSYHCCILGAWYTSLQGTVYAVKFRKLKLAFSSNSQNRTRKSKGNGLLQLCFYLSVYQNNFDTRIYNLISVPQITYFLLENAIISSKRNPCSSSTKQKIGSND